MTTFRKKPFDGVAAMISFKTHCPTPEQVRRRAHEIYLARGGRPDHELEDWLQAENELQQETRLETIERVENSESPRSRPISREEIKGRLVLARAVAHDPQTVFCIEPISSVSDENGERLSNLLARVVANPSRSLLVVTGKEFVFGFLDNDAGLPEDGVGKALTEDYGYEPRTRDRN